MDYITNYFAKTHPNLDTDAAKDAMKVDIQAMHPSKWFWVTADLYHLCQVFAISLNLFKNIDGDLLRCLIDECVRLLESTSALAQLKMDLEGIKHEMWLNKFVCDFTDNLIWILGRHAKSLIVRKQKDERSKDEEEEEKQRETLASKQVVKATL